MRRFGVWVWIVGLFLTGIISQPTLFGWAIITLAIMCLFEPLWGRFESRDLRTFPTVRRGAAIAITAVGILGTWGALQNRQVIDDAKAQIAEGDKVLKNANDLIAHDADRHDSVWKYLKSSDELTDKPVRAECIESINVVRLESPYENTRAQLCLRDSPRFGKDWYVKLVEGGQILCKSYPWCGVKIRFDSDEIKQYKASSPSDGSSNIIFIQGRRQIEGRLKTAKLLRIELEFYQAGKQIVSFDVKGFAWPNEP